MNRSCPFFPGMLLHSVPEPNSAGHWYHFCLTNQFVRHDAVTDGSEVKITTLRYSALASCSYQDSQKLMG